MEFYYTSYYQPGSIYLRFDNNELVFENLYLPANSKTVLLEIQSLSKSECVFSEVLHVKSGNRIKISLNEKGIYFIQIYLESEVKNYYDGVIFKRDIPFYFNGLKYLFVNTVVYSANVDFIRKLSVLEVPKYDYTTAIFDQAQVLTNLINKSYEKILAIHDWTANNFFYDEDGFCTSDYMTADYSFTALINSRKCVCQGYANVCAMLLNSLGIPTIIIECFALGVSTEGGWERENNLNSDANHVMVAAFDGLRWILMDPTWDSPNTFKQGKFLHEGNLSHKYFDMTPNFLSCTHRLISIQNLIR
jgi:hypothetical protein